MQMHFVTVYVYASERFCIYASSVYELALISPYVYLRAVLLNVPASCVLPLLCLVLKSLEVASIIRVICIFCVVFLRHWYAKRKDFFSLL